MSSEVPNKKKSPTSKAPRFDDSQFVNYELSADERERCKKWLTDLAELDDAILKAVQEGYKFSLKWDTYSSAYSAFMTDGLGKTENVGIVNTGRGSTPLKALKQVLYKHYLVFDCVWSPFAAGSRNHDIDD